MVSIDQEKALATLVSAIANRKTSRWIKDA